MSSTVTITGTIALNNSPGGAVTPILIGTPEITAASTTGSEVDYDEKSEFWFLVGATTTKVANFGSITDGKFLYIGTDQDITFKLNGGSEIYKLDADGWLAWKYGEVSALSITAGVVDANVYVLILGD